MNTAAFARLELLARDSAAIERSVEYVTRQLRLFAKKQDRILICFPNNPGTLGEILDRAVREVGAVPIHWGADQRWLTLIRTAFLNKASAVIGPPLVIMGLNKLSKATKTPLYIRHAMTAGYPCYDWMIDGIIHGLDCRTWGYFNPQCSVVLCGQSCGESRGVHIREEEYAIEIVDEDGNTLPEGEFGEICIIPKMDPTLRVRISDHGRINRTPCPCGRPSARLVDFDEGRTVDMELLRLGEELHAWSSVLDVRLTRGEYGLEMEMIVFPGLELPKLPNCAKMVVRNWDPEHDVPFWFEPLWKNQVVFGENH